MRRNLLLAGVALTSAAWFVAWSRLPVLTDHSFFPLWLGYILTVNGVCEWVFGDSLLRRMRLWFVVLFIVSIPMWWGFEYLNSIVHNWYYILPEPISGLEYAIRASINFSIVIPAVLSTTFLFSRWIGQDRLPRKAVRVGQPLVIGLLALSIINFLLVVQFPREAFPLIWIAPLFFIEPLLYFVSSSSLLHLMGRGEWLLSLSLAAGTLFTGFWWEFWNFYSMPKWDYAIPYVDFWRIFDMPILGYGGYLFFGLIIYVYTSLVFSIFFRKDIASMFRSSIRD